MQRKDVTNESEMEKALTFNGGSGNLKVLEFEFIFKVFVEQQLLWDD